jgi:hypothetical protein
MDAARHRRAAPVLQAHRLALRAVKRASTRDRLLAWLVTGPVGRLVAFVWTLAAALLHGAVTKLGRR